MKAWTDVLTLNRPWVTSEGEYFIDMGVKIERLWDGSFRIYNANSANFEEVSSEQYDIFERHGFKPGAYRVMMDYLVDVVRKSRHTVEKRKKIIIKYLEFKKKYINFVKI
jgi:hypothetical protein